jgi:prefoldin alpha subunit
VLEQHIHELLIVEDCLNNVKDLKKGNKILVPLGSGIFVNGNLEDNNEVLLNVGGGVVVKKNFEDAKSLVSKQIEEIRGVFVNLEGEANAILERQAFLRDEINQLSK